MCTHLDGFIVRDDVSHVEGKNRRFCHHLHLHLYISNDTEIVPDEGLKSKQVVEGSEGGGKSHISDLCV